GEADFRAEPPRALHDERLEGILREKHALARAHIPDAGIEVGDELSRRPAYQGLDLHYPAILDELLGGTRANGRLEVGRTQDFHRPLSGVRRTRMNRGARVALDDEWAHSLLRPQQARRQSDETAADDRDGDFDVACHLSLPRCKAAADTRGRCRHCTNLVAAATRGGGHADGQALKDKLRRGRAGFMP